MQKTRAQNIEFLPNGGHFRDDQNLQKKFKNGREINFLKIDFGDHKNPLSSKKCLPFIQILIF